MKVTTTTKPKVAPTYPCLMQGVKSGNIYLAVGPCKQIVLKSGGYSKIGEICLNDDSLVLPFDGEITLSNS